MSKRTYGQYCPVARALEVVGERWALLIVRDLLLGPQRFTDLQRGLGKVPSNILSARLKELEEADVIARRALPRPASAVVYELTDYGWELEPIVTDLLLWGAKSLGPPRPDEAFSPNSFLLGFRVGFQPEAAKDLHATFEIRIEDAAFTIRVAGGELELSRGPADSADLTIETDLGLGALLQGEITPEEAEKSGVVKLTGKTRLLRSFAKAFRLPAAEVPAPVSSA